MYMSMFLCFCLVNVFICPYLSMWAFQVAEMVKNPPANAAN